MKATLTLALTLCTAAAWSQTDVSLGWRSDSTQTAKAVSVTGDEYRKVLHHGPAIENMNMAVRIYFNHSGAVDVYSKANPSLELARYRWYPTEAEMAAGAGCDEYRVGKTIGLGGISLWDGEKEVKLVATRGREATARRTKKGAEICMLSKGVPYKGDTIDVAVRVTACNDSRWMTVEAECVSGQKVQFVTGVNYHEGEDTDMGTGYVAAWGVHPTDVVKNPLPIGGALRYDARKISRTSKTADMLMVVSKPARRLRTRIVAACSKEKEINNRDAFVAFVRNQKK